MNKHPLNNLLTKLPPFYLGQSIIYITGNVMPINSEHSVRGLWWHACGCWSVDIGKTDNKLYSYCCDEHFDKSSGTPPTTSMWFRAQAFRSKDSLKTIQLSRVIEQEKQFTSCN